MVSLKEIKLLRKKYNLTQKQLAKQAGVSQSLIAKIEAERIDPTYSKVKMIFIALERLKEGQEIKAEEVMNKDVFFSNRGESVKKIIEIMKNKGISQMPVKDSQKIIGVVSESTILSKILKFPEKATFLKVEEVLEDGPPIVSKNTKLTTISYLLQEFSLVLVVEKGEIKGVITKTDLLTKI